MVKRQKPARAESEGSDYHLSEEEQLDIGSGYESAATSVDGADDINYRCGECLGTISDIFVD